ncbi:MAG: ATP-binding protein [Thermoplasmata archaeon]
MLDEPIGIIFGNVKREDIKVALKKPVHTRTFVKFFLENHGEVLCYINEISRNSTLTKQGAIKLMNGLPVSIDESPEASLKIVGYLKDGLFEYPQIPPPAGTEIYMADDELIKNVLGINVAGNGYAYLGILDGYKIPVNIPLQKILNKHFSVIAKTGSGKSYFVAVLLEELIKNKITTLVIDPHDEYNSLNYENNIEKINKEFGVMPLSFASHIKIIHFSKEEGIYFSIKEVDPDFLLSFTNLKGDGYSTMLSDVIRKHKHSLYDIDELANLLRAEEDVKAEKLADSLISHPYKWLFSSIGTPFEKIIEEGKTTIISLKGLDPRLQEFIVKSIATMTFDAMKNKKYPILAFIVEEAHNFVPQQGMAYSSEILRSIASEGRKFGLGLGIVSQRPAKIDKNILSQCGTQITLQVTNSLDLKAISNSMEGYEEGMENIIQNLTVGKALLSGYAVKFPLVIKVRSKQSLEI